MFLKSVVLTVPSVYSWKKRTVQPIQPVFSLGVPERGERGLGLCLRRTASKPDASPTVAWQGNAGRASLSLPTPFSQSSYFVHTAL